MAARLPPGFELCGGRTCEPAALCDSCRRRLELYLALEAERRRPVPPRP